MKSAACTCPEAGRNPGCGVHGGFAGDPTGGYSNLPTSAVVQGAAGVCGIHGVYVGRSCPKCVTQPKGAGMSEATTLGTVSSLTCSKCGGEDILVRWHKTGGRYGGDGSCGYYAQVVETGEHMHFTCRTCQYEWTGVPADAAA